MAFQQNAPGNHSNVSGMQSNAEYKASEPKETLNLNSIERTMTPLTIKQVYGGLIKEGRAFVDGKPLSDVVLYGTVESIGKQTANTVVMLNDLTSRPIAVKFWADNNAIVASKLTELKTNTLVRVIGRINRYQNGWEMSAFDVWKATPSEFMQHGCEVVFAHLTNTATPEESKRIFEHNVAERNAFERQSNQRLALNQNRSPMINNSPRPNRLFAGVQQQHHNGGNVNNSPLNGNGNGQYRANHNGNQQGYHGQQQGMSPMNNHRGGQQSMMGQSPMRNAQNVQNGRNGMNRGAMNGNNGRGFGNQHSGSLRAAISRIIRSNSNGVSTTCSKATILRALRGENAAEVQEMMAKMEKEGSIITSFDESGYFMTK